jgi:hypothetical protein
MRDLLTGNIGVSPIPAQAVYEVNSLGPTAYPTGLATNAIVHFPVLPAYATEVVSTHVFALIFAQRSGTPIQTPVINQVTGSSAGINVQANGDVCFTLGGFNAHTGALAQIGHNYFVVGCGNYINSGNRVVRGLVLDMTTGQLIIMPPSGTWGQTSQASLDYGALCVGGGVVGDRRIAAVMYANQVLTVAEMLKWAEDPWSLWYATPNRLRTTASKGLTTSVTVMPTKFDSWTHAINTGAANLSSDQLYVMLTNTLPNHATAQTYTDISSTEVANGNGYTTGGKIVLGTSTTNSGGLETVAGSSVTWNVTGTGITARYFVLYDHATGKLINFGDYLSSFTATSGQSISWTPTSGTLYTLGP